MGFDTTSGAAGACAACFLLPKEKLGREERPGREGSPPSFCSASAPMVAITSVIITRSVKAALVPPGVAVLVTVTGRFAPAPARTRVPTQSAPVLPGKGVGVGWKFAG